MKTKMKSFTALILACALSAFAGCSSPNQNPTEPNDNTVAATATSNSEITEKSTWDELDSTQITSYMGIGWNLGNQLEAISGSTPEETAWGNPVVTKELIDSVKAQGFNTVRIPVSYLSKIGEGPDYTVDEAWLNRVNEVVDYVIDNDMYAVINMHGDGYYTIEGGWLLCAEDDEKQAEIVKKYEAVWTQIAEKFKNYDEHLIFESMNEEFDNTYGKPNSKAYENINTYNNTFVNAVRKTGGNNEKRWLLIPGWNTNIEYTAGDYGFVIPDDSLCTSDGKRLMISVHYYDPYNFTIDESIASNKTQWGKYAVEDFDNWGQEDHVDAMMKMLNDKFISQGYPVIIGEMGVQDKTHIKAYTNEFRRYWCEYVVKSAKSNGCVCIYWDNGWNGNYGLGLFDRLTDEVTQPEIIEGMMRAANAAEEYEIPAPVISE